MPSESELPQAGEGAGERMSPGGMAEPDAIRFLEADFAQCFEQMRHYDGQLLGVFKFVFSAYATVIGTALGLYQFSAEKQIDMGLTVKALLAVGLLMGLFSLWQVVRLREYYVRVARYVNEVRGSFLPARPGGLRNVAGLYTGPGKPTYFSLGSSHTVLLCMVAVINAAITVGLGGFEYGLWTHGYWKGGAAFVGVFLLQAVPAVMYLTSKARPETRVC